MNLILFGRQGSGKGTQATALAQHFHARVLGAGDLLREAARKDPLLKKKLDVGAFAPDSSIEKLLRQNLQGYGSDGIIFEGFVRNAKQQVIMDRVLRTYGGPPPIAVLFDIPEDVAIERILERKVCSRCQTPSFPLIEGYAQGICQKCGGTLVGRSDDTPQTIKKRLRLYGEQTEPILKRYQAQKRLIVVDGTPSIQAVTKQAIHALHQYLGRP